MRVVYGSVELADGESTHTSGDSFGSTRQNQQVPRLRADYQGLYARGNRLNTVAFSVSRKFDSIDEAKSFVFTHEASLPDDGTLEMETGSASIAATAVLNSISLVRTGLRVAVSYNFTARQFIETSTAEELNLDDIPDPDVIPDPDHIPT